MSQPAPAAAPTAAAAADSLKRKREDDADNSAGAADVKVKLELGTEPAARKKRRWDTQDPSAAVAAAAKPAAAAAPVTATSVLSAAEKAAALQKSIADRLAALKVPKKPGVVVGVKTEPFNPAFASPSVIVKDESKMWQPLRLDAMGRAIDEKGNLLIQNRPTELKANIRGAEAAKAAAAPAVKLERAKIASTIYKEEGQSKFYDPRMHDAPNPGERKSRALEFVKPGKYIQQAQTLRMKQLEKEFASTSSSSAAKPDHLSHTSITILKPPAVLPSVEWWDAKILKDPSAGYPQGGEAELNEVVVWDRITSFIYHPVPVESLTLAPPPPPMPVLLTKAEQKKIKKREKLERMKDQRDRVRLGIEAPAEPKMRIQNLMNVLLNDTVADPSLMEARVRAQMQQRVEGHLDANASRKLTAEQKAEKRRRKYAEDISHEVHVAVYRAGELGEGHGKTRYQVDINTQQWNLAGVAVLHPDCSVVVVEGGPKNQRRFRRLMLHRIKWRKKRRSEMEKEEARKKGEHVAEEQPEEEDDDEEDDSDSDDDSAAGSAAPSSDANTTRSKTGACALLWSGIIPKTRFPGARFTFESCRSEAMARNHLARMGMENYWDMAKAYSAGTHM